MIRTTFVAALTLGCGLGAQAREASSEQTQATTLKELVAKMRDREKVVRAALMEMVTRGSYPGGVTFRIEGTVRVLGETHFHSTNRTTFEDDLTTELEQVKTPEGAWIREKGPAFGEVFLEIRPELLAQLEAAEAVLAGAEGAGRTMDNPAKDPLGSAMLESLSRRFALEVQRRVIKGRDFFVVHGPVRAGAPPDENPDVASPDRIELLVRTPDLAVVRMTQFKAGAEIMQVEIKRLELNGSMGAESFRIELPEGVYFKDVMDHPPHATQIRLTLENAEAKKESAKEARDAESEDRRNG